MGTPEERIAALEKKVTDQASTIEQQQKTISAMSKKSTNDNQERIAALETQVKDQSATAQQQQKTIDSLTKELGKATTPESARKEEKPKLPEDTFIVEKKKYKFVVASFSYGGQKLTALDALADKEILADLVRKGSGVIAEVH